MTAIFENREVKRPRTEDNSNAMDVEMAKDESMLHSFVKLTQSKGISFFKSLSILFKTCKRCGSGQHQATYCTMTTIWLAEYRCRRCGDFNHKTEKCTLPAHFKCYRCSGTGHKIDICPKLMSEADVIAVRSRNATATPSINANKQA